MNILIGGPVEQRESVWEGKARTSYLQPAWLDTGARFPIKVMIRVSGPTAGFEPDVEYELLPSAFVTDERDNLSVKFNNSTIGQRVSAKPAQVAKA